jgi:hypothetical protein
MIYNPKVYVDKSPIHGWGVFAKEDIMECEVFEECPVLTLPIKKGEITSLLIDYRFNWPQGNEWEEQVFTLGFGALYNHNEKILDYLLKRNIDINYNFVVPENKSNTCNNPLLIAINNDVYNNINIYTKKILDKIKNNVDKNDSKNDNNTLNNIKNPFLDNALHAIIYMRINYLETTFSPEISF